MSIYRQSQTIFLEHMIFQTIFATLNLLILRRYIFHMIDLLFPINLMLKCVLHSTTISVDAF
uniref:Uncharacterized protein n=1 Tax=Arundo donax TaxID=35708 RepID=A0A0A9B228_ARUDO